MSTVFVPQKPRCVYRVDTGRPSGWDLEGCVYLPFMRTASFWEAIRLPLILYLPCMNPVWAFILPVNRSMNTASVMISVQSAFFGLPSLSVPSFFRSRVHGLPPISNTKTVLVFFTISGVIWLLRPLRISATLDMVTMDDPH